MVLFGHFLCLSPKREMYCSDIFQIWVAWSESISVLHQDCTESCHSKKKKKKMDACLSNKKALFFQVHSGQVKRRVLCYPWTFESISPQTTVASGQLSCILTWNPETERAILQRKNPNPGILAKSTTGHKITVSVTEG